jgi:hypothetical protein
MLQPGSGNQPVSLKMKQMTINKKIILAIFDLIEKVGSERESFLNHPIGGLERRVLHRHKMLQL